VHSFREAQRCAIVGECMSLREKSHEELLRAAMNYRLLAACWMERADLLQREVARLDPSSVLLDLPRPLPHIQSEPESREHSRSPPDTQYQSREPNLGELLSCACNRPA
jgi:hypothetical protein